MTCISWLLSSQVIKHAYLDAMQWEIFMGRKNTFYAFKHSPTRTVLAFYNTILFSAFWTASFVQKVAEAIMSQSFIQETCSEFEPFVHLILFSSLARQKQVGIITHIGLSMPFSLFFFLSSVWEASGRTSSCWAAPSRLRSGSETWGSEPLEWLLDGSEDPGRSLFWVRKEFPLPRFSLRVTKRDEPELPDVDWAESAKTDRARRKPEALRARFTVVGWSELVRFDIRERWLCKTQGYIKSPIKSPILVYVRGLLISKVSVGISSK